MAKRLVSHDVAAQLAAGATFMEKCVRYAVKCVHSQVLYSIRTHDCQVAHSGSGCAAVGDFDTG